MFDKIVFYNFYHQGDVHCSRSLVRYVINEIPAKDYIYCHYHDSKILDDIENLVYWTGPTFPISSNDCWKVIDNILYANTWFGACDMKYLKQYGLSLLGLYNLFRDGLKDCCGYDLLEDIIEFIPDIDFSKFDINNNIDIFMKRNLATKRILIVNGNVLSGQSINFNFSPIIEEIASKFNDYHFYISNYPKEVCRDNVFYCKDIIDIEGNDIVETAYFGNFCSVIVGRASGVYSYCINKENLIRNPKKFVCFSNQDMFADCGISEHLIGSKKNRIVSDNFSESNIIDTIVRNCC